MNKGRYKLKKMKEELNGEILNEAQCLKCLEVTMATNI